MVTQPILICKMQTYKSLKALDGTTLKLLMKKLVAAKVLLETGHLLANVLLRTQLTKLLTKQTLLASEITSTFNHKKS